MKSQKINILNIIRGTTVDGPGFRTSIYFAGCSHECPGCHNPASWDFSAGTPYSLDEILEIVEEEDFDVTLSGGDPLYHPEFTSLLIDAVNRMKHNVWVYTGFTWEEIIESERLLNAVKGAQVVVDSPFKIELRDPDLLFRGSSNQRLIDVGKSLTGHITEWRR
ncbi:MAG: anaerobic ribonucleoside-triphosphate reductase activating protein [Muribaculaceae bacterium]|nr:anaerobic ribonucleoside-triphosphate reductase activating protein [Muribaculaceae bacterium]